MMCQYQKYIAYDLVVFAVRIKPQSWTEFYTITHILLRCNIKTTIVETKKHDDRVVKKSPLGS